MLNGIYHVAFFLGHWQCFWHPWIFRPRPSGRAAETQDHNQGQALGSRCLTIH